MPLSAAGIDRAHYHGWGGKLHSPWWGALSVARVTLVQIFRRKLYWILIGFGLIQFLALLGVISYLSSLEAKAGGALEKGKQSPSSKQPEPAGKPGLARPRLQEGIRKWLNFEPQPGVDGNRDNGYLAFIDAQNYIVFILLSFGGGLVVGADFQHRALAFYLSRRIDRWHYLIGKWLGLASVIAILTLLPALVLFVQYGMFHDTFEYWIQYAWILRMILGYGLFLCLVLGLVVMTMSVFLRRTVPIAITCLSTFLLLHWLGSLLTKQIQNEHWRLLSLWRDIRYAARFCFDAYPRPDDRTLGPWALAILAATCLTCIVLLHRRVQAVEVIE